MQNNASIGTQEILHRISVVSLDPVGKESNEAKSWQRVPPHTHSAILIVSYFTSLSFLKFPAESLQALLYPHGVGACVYSSVRPDLHRLKAWTGKLKAPFRVRDESSPRASRIENH